LFGDVNPSGKLPLTFPAHVADLPRPVIATPKDSITPFPVDYTVDGYNTGYKWYERQGFTPLFPFGFGLTYTTFAMSNAQVSATTTGNNFGFQLSLQLQNTGRVPGAEVVQVYLELPASTGEPRRLVGWQKVLLTPGQQQVVTIQVNGNDSSHPLSYWDSNSHAWVAPPGTYNVYLGNSSTAVSAVGSFEMP